LGFGGYYLSTLQHPAPLNPTYNFLMLLQKFLDPCQVKM
jgi:hypothetical protein